MKENEKQVHAEGRMQQESTCCVELMSPLKRALEEAGLGRGVSSACPKRPLSRGVEFFRGHALLLMTPACGHIPHLQHTTMGQQPGVLGRAWVGGHPGHAPGLCCRPLYHRYLVRPEGRGLPPAWTVFPAHVPCEHLLIPQVLAADYLT